MKRSFEYRAQARETLANHWGEAAIISAIIVIITSIFAVPSSVAGWKELIITQMTFEGMSLAVTVLLALPLQFAFYNILRGLIHGAQHVSLQEEIDECKKDYSRYVVTGVLMVIVIAITAIFTFGILAIILALAYSMVPFLLHDYPSLTPKEALRTSREMMRGHKWELFVLNLSFIGWAVLCIFTCGIGYLFLEPYMHTSIAHFYEDLKKETIVDEETNAPQDAEVVEAEVIESKISGNEDDDIEEVEAEEVK